MAAAVLLRALEPTVGHAANTCPPGRANCRPRSGAWAGQIVRRDGAHRRG